MLPKSEFYRCLLLVIVMEVAAIRYVAASCTGCRTFSNCSDCPPLCVVKVTAYKKERAPLFHAGKIISCYGTLASRNKILTPAYCLSDPELHSVKITYRTRATETVQKSDVALFPGYNGGNNLDIGIVSVLNSDCVPHCCSSCFPLDESAAGITVGGTNLSSFTASQPLSCCAASITAYRECQAVYGDATQFIESRCEEIQCDGMTALGAPLFFDGNLVGFSTTNSSSGYLTEALLLAFFPNFVNNLGINCAKPPPSLQPDCDCPTNPSTTLMISECGYVATCECLVKIDIVSSSSDIPSIITCLGTLVAVNRILMPGNVVPKNFDFLNVYYSNDLGKSNPNPEKVPAYNVRNGYAGGNSVILDFCIASVVNPYNTPHCKLTSRSINSCTSLTGVGMNATTPYVSYTKLKAIPAATCGTYYGDDIDSPAGYDSACVESLKPSRPYLVQTGSPVFCDDGKVVGQFTKTPKRNDGSKPAELQLPGVVATALRGNGIFVA